eukprot:286620-Pelagomonas_calceolata.AAC.9
MGHASNVKRFSRRRAERKTTVITSARGGLEKLSAATSPPGANLQMLLTCDVRSCDAWTHWAYSVVMCAHYIGCWRPPG